MGEPYRAFWQDPDWSGGDNLRDRGTEPFWMLPPLEHPVAAPRATAPGTPRCPGFHEIPNGWEVCGPFVTLWTGYRYCKVCEQPAP